MNDLKYFEAFTKVKDSAKKRQDTNALIYTRVSSKEQADTGNSLETQLKACEEYAARKGYEVLEHFGGTYESAKDDERKEFQRMLNFIKRHKNKVDTIIVYTVDRFSRTGGNAIYLAENLKKEGVRLESCMHQIDTSTASGELNQGILFLFGKFENQQRREKCMAGMIEALKKGYWMGKAPMGYDSVMRNGQQQMSINKTGELIKQAFMMKIKEGLSNTAIIAKLGRMGLFLHNQTLTKIFRNPFYCGIITNKLLGAEVVVGRHEPLISKEIFFKVNNIQSANPQGYVVQQEDENLPLRQHIKCDCGTMFTGYEVKKKGLHYYKCNRIGCKCNKSAKSLHQQYVDLLKIYQIDPRLMPALKVALTGVFDELNAQQLEQQKEFKRQLTEVEKNLDKLEERYIFEGLNKDLYEKYSVKLKGERKEIEVELEKTEKPLSNRKNFIELGLKMGVNLCESWEKGDYRERRRVQSVVFPEGVTFDKEKQGYRTSRVNVFFSLTALFSERLKEMKKGKTSDKPDFSLSVVHRGLLLALQ
ncbi:recombinase family protein [Adhaeribacter soli]|uniref:Recombinase family protein n=1 Tax=Adhaeribacter soli TaxID=2607655 RepID=A0A5N1IX40_9BACT|nr:recombinase family protein [Adhaeribacter soli]KAA9338801.1 recombinase family protein [Adhaeribacter soli]